MVSLLSGKVFLVITGASQGIGAQIAVNFAHLLEQDSQILLLARNTEGLKETAAKFPKYSKVSYESIDLSVATADLLEETIIKALGSEKPTDFKNAVIVHNAASVGDVRKSTIEMTDFDELRKYYDLNVVSPIVLNGVFMKIFNDDSKVNRLVINITSYCGIQPMKSTGFYGPGKAAREFYFKIFAAEFPTVNVLNYSPGPVQTEMLETLGRGAGDLETREAFAKLRENNGVLTTEQTVDRMILVLRDQKYKSGDHVDYYDQL